jgi:hypothetical protein
MPLTEKYTNKVHEAYQATQAKGGMTNKNVTKVQKLLKYYYPELKVDGWYGGETIEAINGFYEKYYWTKERRLQEAKDKHGEDYIMKSELEAMQESQKQQ